MKDKDFFLNCLKQAQKERNLASFVTDLFTPGEISDLAQRLKIAKGIVADKTYQKVSDKVDASTSTVTKVGQIIKYGKGAFQKLFARTEHSRSGGEK